MKNGAVAAVLKPDGRERQIAAAVSAIDAYLGELREMIRSGAIMDDGSALAKSSKKVLASA